MQIRISEERLAKVLNVTTRRVREACINSKIAPAKYNFESAVSEFMEKANDKNKDFVTVKRLSEILGITDKNVRELVDRNILIRSNSNNFELIPNVKAYIDYLNSNSENAQYKREQIEYLKLKRLEKAKELHNASDIRNAISSMLIAIRQKLLNLPKRESRHLVGVTDRVQIEDILEKSVNEALEELSEYKFKPGEVEDGTENSWVITRHN